MRYHGLEQQSQEVQGRGVLTANPRQAVKVNTGHSDLNSLGDEVSAEKLVENRGNNTERTQMGHSCTMKLFLLALRTSGPVIITSILAVYAGGTQITCLLCEEHRLERTWNNLGGSSGYRYENLDAALLSCDSCATRLYVSPDWVYTEER